MSRWYHRLSSNRLSREYSNNPKRQVHAVTCSDHVGALLKSATSTTIVTDIEILDSDTVFRPSHKLLYQAKELADREDFLSERSHQLLVRKLRLLEEDTSLAQQYDILLRERANSPEAAAYYREEVQTMMTRWQEIKQRKHSLAEQHEQLETAIEMLATDKGRWAEDYQQQYGYRLQG